MSRCSRPIRKESTMLQLNSFAVMCKKVRGKPTTLLSLISS